MDWCFVVFLILLGMVAVLDFVELLLDRDITRLTQENQILRKTLRDMATQEVLRSQTMNKLTQELMNQNALRPIDDVKHRNSNK